METNKENLLTEFKELNEKSVKLDAFLHTDKYYTLDLHRRELLTLEKNAIDQLAHIIAFRCVAEGISPEEFYKL